MYCTPDAGQKKDSGQLPNVRPSNTHDTESCVINEPNQKPSSSKPSTSNDNQTSVSNAMDYSHGYVNLVKTCTPCKGDDKKNLVFENNEKRLGVAKHLSEKETRYLYLMKQQMEEHEYLKVANESVYEDMVFPNEESYTYSSS